MSAEVFISSAGDGMGKFDRSTLSPQNLNFIFSLDKVDGICSNRDNSAKYANE